MISIFSPRIILLGTLLCAVPVQAQVQIQVIGGEIRSRLNRQTQLRTGLPGVPERTSVNHTLTTPSPGRAHAEGIYERTGDNFFVCSKPLQPVSGLAIGSAGVIIRNIGTAPVQVRGMILISTHGKGTGWCQLIHYGVATTNFTSPGSYAIDKLLMPSGRLSVGISASQDNQGTQPGSPSALAIASFSVESTICQNQSVVNETAGMVEGFDGLTPILSFAGCARSGTGHIDLRVTRPNSSSVLLIGLPGGPGLSIFGGILWPTNFGSFPMQTGSGSMGLGSWSIPVSLSPSVLGKFMLQALVLDPAAVQGIAFSNTLTLSLQ